MVKSLAARRNFLFLSLFVYLACFTSALAQSPAPGASAPVPELLAHAKTHRLKWSVRYDHKSPDCYKKIAITINGRLPGPTIHATQGDRITVEVTNSLLTENIAIHWHGIRQKGTPWADGTERITQCPIQPGDKFIYDFVVDRAGTYMYHAHYGLQMGAGLYGMIIVKPPRRVKEPFHYNFDHHILLTDWYHKSSYEHFIDLTSIPFKWVGEPQSILIHGRGKFDCAKSGEHDLCNATNPECDYYSLSVKPDETIRLRIGCLTTLSTLSFQIEDHMMTVVEADGHYVEPFEVDHLYLYSGETYSVLIKTKPASSSRNFWMSAKVVARESEPPIPRGLGILKYPNDPNKPPKAELSGPAWEDTKDRIEQSKKYKAHKDYIRSPEKSDKHKQIVLLNTQNVIDGRTRWSLNHVSLNLPYTPYLIALKDKLHDFDREDLPDMAYNYADYDIQSIPSAKATTSDRIYWLPFNSTVDVILQNANTMNPGVSETHPWHLHGHDFWVLGYGQGKFDPIEDPRTYNLKNPIMKNSVPLHPFGWTALRFRNDNPGVWAFHCHIEYHYAIGMAVVFESGSDQVKELPESIKGCGLTKGKYKP